MTDDAALAAIYGALEDMICQGEVELAAVLQKLVVTITEEVNDLGNRLKKLHGKIVRRIDKEHVDISNQLTFMQGRIGGAIFDALNASEFTLTMLASKAGMVKPGENIDQVTIERIEHSYGEREGVKIVLSVRELLPIWRQLIEVLKEIRDRMPWQPSEQPFELRATEEPDEGNEFEWVISGWNDRLPNIA